MTHIKLLKKLIKDTQFKENLEAIIKSKNLEIYVNYKNSLIFLYFRTYAVACIK